LTNRRRSWQRKIKLSKEDKRGLKQKKSTSKGHKSKVRDKTKGKGQRQKNRGKREKRQEKGQDKKSYFKGKED